ncbi:hypothetical protein SO802_009899 [Lithocarpus litseifolius]|uniref:Uncharacterized protein n=1 Tax=Lithocarpus litseifolius TaxID=425828 RepID=A0AAW2DD95_9ROSI
MHWVGWEKVTRPKTEGGLGIQTAKGRNMAYLAKFNWRFHEEKESLWEISKGPLRSLVHDPLQKGKEDLKIGEVVPDRGWNWSKLSMELPTEVLMEIKAMPCSCISNEKDRLIWAASSNGEFNLSSAYNLAIKLPDPSNTFNGKWIWKMKVLPKI